MANKAVCIGINKYQQSPLRGCVNDALDIYSFLSDSGVPKDNMRVLLDERATKQAILERFAWLCEDTKAGDHLFFHISGHGTMIRRWSDAGVLGSVMEACLVPFGYDWSDDQSFIFDDDLHEIYDAYISSPLVDMTFIFDVCHAGGMRDVLPLGATSRYLRPPPDVEMRHRDRDLKVRWLQIDREEKHRNLAACQEDQTAADSTFGMDGRPNGAFTWALLQSFRQGDARTWLQVMEYAGKLLKKEGFRQVPVLRARPAAINSYPLH